MIAALLDYEKSFTKVNHNKVLIRLADWGTPPYLLRVIASYLSNREMIVRYKGGESPPYPLKARGPMGDVLGMIIFLVEVSDCLMDPPPPLPPGSSAVDVSCVPAPPPPLQTDKELRLKYLDDALAGECINLKTQVRASQPIIGPRTFHDRNGLELIPGASLLQGRLNDLKDYTMHHDMSINLSKTRIIPFNWTRKHQVFPRLKYDDITFFR